MQEFSIEPSTLRRACKRIGIEYRSHYLTDEEFAALTGGKSKHSVNVEIDTSIDPAGENNVRCYGMTDLSTRWCVATVKAGLMCAAFRLNECPAEARIPEYVWMQLSGSRRLMARQEARRLLACWSRLLAGLMPVHVDCDMPEVWPSKRARLHFLSACRQISRAWNIALYNYEDAAGAAMCLNRSAEFRGWLTWKWMMLYAKSMQVADFAERELQWR